ncbi:hypothetical protein GCM10027275_08200 [Rhabdobacter roseus]|uniref:Outer membrane protein beta-barrel domain-containing protein n=1 Tax=Rhabdobacter roseus TaxID=1655419 RepID=A0A840TRS4_9BACT|nr:hypothetical protein [Rhabdobacter roseus]MBB5282720.1 hypothetical protein [Rhabdobacter roseus]
MKTNHFEDTLRRKLESIEPRFQEQDWERMQQHMQAHTPPTFWQSYGSWVGYAASLLIVGALAGVFLHQRSQNDALRQELATLREQVSQQQSLAATPPPKPDTVYIVEKQLVYQPSVGTSYRQNPAQKYLAEGALPSAEVLVAQSTPEADALTTGPPPVSGAEITDSGQVSPAQRQALIDLEELAYQPELLASSTDLDRAFRKRQPRASAHVKVPSQSLPTQPESTQQLASSKKGKRLLPFFNLKVPLRVGGGQQWEDRYRATSLFAEVLVGKHFGINTGVSWQKLEQKKFFTEKVFRDQMFMDFRKAHAVALPSTFEIFNINTRATLLQVPLNVTYRGDMGNDFSFFTGLGTAINLQARQNLTFDYRQPTQEYAEQQRRFKEPMPALNNVLVSAGVEKRWAPIVVQVDSYLNTQIRTFPFLNDRSSLGLRVKLLYEFGGNKI